MMKPYEILNTAMAQCPYSRKCFTKSYFNRSYTKPDHFQLLLEDVSSLQKTHLLFIIHK